jgi:hypothetical protein
MPAISDLVVISHVSPAAAWASDACIVTNSVNIKYESLCMTTSEALGLSAGIRWGFFTFRGRPSR